MTSRQPFRSGVDSATSAPGLPWELARGVPPSDAISYPTRSAIIDQANASDTPNIMFGSMIATPAWIAGPGTPGAWVCFYTAHNGNTIYAAHAATPDADPGDWTHVSTGITLTRCHTITSTTPHVSDHISSAHCVIDEVGDELKLYWHVARANDSVNQATWVATATTALDTWTIADPAGVDVIDDPNSESTYARPILMPWGNWITVNSTSKIFRSSEDDAKTGWTAVFYDDAGGNWYGPNRPNPPEPRHSCILMIDTTMHLFYTRIADAPERVMVCTVDTDDVVWEQPAGSEIIRAEYTWEGADEDPDASSSGASTGLENGLRDPHVVYDITAGTGTDATFWLVYTYGGEYGIGICDITDYVTAWAASNGKDLDAVDIWTDVAPTVSDELVHVPYPVVVAGDAGNALDVPGYHIHDLLCTGKLQVTITHLGGGNSNQNVIFFNVNETLTLNKGTPEMRLLIAGTTYTSALSGLANGDTIITEIDFPGSTFRTKRNAEAWTATTAIVGDWSAHLGKVLTMGARASGVGILNGSITSLVAV